MVKMIEVQETDGYALQTPAEPWAYVVDDTGIAYRRGLVAQKLRPGWWPFAHDDPEREQRERHPLRTGNVPQECGVAAVRLSPDCQLYAWRNEYVTVGPDPRVPHLASATLTLWVAPQTTLRVGVSLNLQDLTCELGRMPEDAPAEIRDEAHMKARKLIEFFRAECAARDTTKPRPATAADLEEERRAKRTARLAGYCAANGLSFEAPEFSWIQSVTIGGEQMTVVEASIRFDMPDLFREPLASVDIRAFCA
jgi:hypothetical protein